MVIITLTTDFGLQDEYVGVVKGVILGRAPSAHIVDLSHAISPYDIRMAACLISASYSYFPPGTIHLLIVDPGVGGPRDIVVLLLGEHIFLAPDNGVLTLLLEENPGVLAFRASNQNLFLSPISKTFHGRDIFAPLAAYLANGGSVAGVGPEVSADTLQRIALEKPLVDSKERSICGEIIHIDIFGNAMSNIRESSLALFSSTPSFPPLVVTVNGSSITPLRGSYQEAHEGETAMLFNSRGYLEIVVNQGSAADRLQIKLGDSVLLREHRKNL